MRKYGLLNEIVYNLEDNRLISTIFETIKVIKLK